MKQNATGKICNINFEQSVHFRETEEKDENTFSFTVYSGEFLPTGFPMILVDEKENIHFVEEFKFDVNGMNMERFEQNPVVLFQHDTSRLPIGRANIRKEDEKLVGDITFDVGDNFGRLIRNKVSNDFLRAVSMGINFDEQNFELDEEGRAIFKTSEFIELSVVNIPRDPNALKTKFAASGYGILNFKDIKTERNLNMELDKDSNEHLENKTSDEQFSEVKAELERMKEENTKAHEQFKQAQSEKEKALEQLNEKLKELEELSANLEEVKGKLSEKEEELSKRNKALSVNENSFEENLTWQQAIDKLQKEEQLSYVDAFLKANEKYKHLKGE